MPANSPLSTKTFKFLLQGQEIKSIVRVKLPNKKNKMGRVQTGTGKKQGVPYVEDAEYGNLEFSRLLTQENEQFDEWADPNKNTQAELVKNCTVELINEQKQPIMRYAFDNAVITDIEPPELNAEQGDKAVEKYTADFEDVRYERVGVAQEHPGQI